MNKQTEDFAPVLLTPATLSSISLPLRPAVSETATRIFGTVRAETSVLALGKLVEEYAVRNQHQTTQDTPYRWSQRG
jgi:hypothetical protein